MQTLLSPRNPLEKVQSLKGIETTAHQGFSVPDPSTRRKRPGTPFFNAILATALFRCWHILIFFGAWATMVSVVSHNVHNLSISNILLTVIGTVLGFVISYRTTSSFERYNEGRRLWSQIILASRTFARTLWFHIPDSPATETISAEEMKARAMIERKTVINLLEAYSVAIKHYLRGEDGIYYKDLYYLVKFLPGYALPAGIPSDADLVNQDPYKNVWSPMSLPQDTTTALPTSDAQRIFFNGNSLLYNRTPGASMSAPHLPLPATTSTPGKMSIPEPPSSPGFSLSIFGEKGKRILPKSDEKFLLPPRMPPKYHIFDLFPFSLLVKMLTKKGKEVKGRKAARMRAKMRHSIVSHNLPLEISLYLSSYIAALQQRKSTDVPTINTLLAALNQLVDGLTGLERILTTPIPFSYSVHLWVVTIIYCLALPFQIWTPLKWLTIPATVILSFIFFGFLVAGEEIENPFGYDKNDLNLDHFTHNIIRTELRAITSTAAPDPALWAFSPENNLVFASNIDNDERITPEEWLERGRLRMQQALTVI